MGTLCKTLSNRDNGQTRRRVIEQARTQNTEKMSSTTRVNPFFVLSIHWALVLAVLALVGPAAAAAAVDGGGDPGKLFIQAEGDLLTQYDMAEVTLNIDAEDRSNSPQSASIAQSKHQDTSQDLIAFIEGELGIPLENMTTTTMDISPIYNYSDGVNEVIGYEVSNSIKIITAISNIGALPKLYEEVASYGGGGSVVVSVYGFDPYISDELRDYLEEELFEQAMAKASRKARMYASGAGRELGPVMVMSDTPIAVNEGSSSSSSSGDQNNARSAPMMQPLYGALESDSAAPETNGFLVGQGEKLTKTIYLEYKLL